MIMTDRDEFVGFHTTFENKEALRREAERRKTTMSKMIDDWVTTKLLEAAHEELEPIRSNKRLHNEIDVPLDFEE